MAAAWLPLCEITPDRLAQVLPPLVGERAVEVARDSTVFHKGHRTHPTPRATGAAQQSVAARLATLGGHRHRRGAMVVAIFCGKDLCGCETQRTTRHQTKALRGLIATPMGRTEERQAAGPFLLHSCDGQSAPDLHRSRHVVRHWIKAADTLDIPPECCERCDSLPKRR